mmetsp:Transcript_18844/g.52578  ORF Transcript_18844/g.52578 Transcript_18844/m.52578 type:complete len:379 (-) Transcript_18844:473-1609(-)|eukprot:CAMPEP_0117669456 /NCGR_PEP_ID=MMETSP0804-20121206/12145_1 /TAXON_ID=1074897 /ORGANISM="Tetraselmis astigmatica, Strain CCMP880" /LENGTH=378 /DNA_ID=CAMNT_0005477521 /DNA_START=384 /DNA_END=1520 /DNA_ORIENTATION=+
MVGPGLSAEMEFWAVEIPPGKAVEVTLGGTDPDEDEGLPTMELLHITNMALAGEPLPKKRYTVTVESSGNRAVAGTLLANQIEQCQMDLIFSEDLKISHTGPTPVHLSGYKSVSYAIPSDIEDDSSEEEEEDDDDEVPILVPSGARKVEKIIDDEAEEDDDEEDDSGEDDDDDEDDEEESDDDAEPVKGKLEDRKAMVKAIKEQQQMQYGDDADEDSEDDDSEDDEDDDSEEEEEVPRPTSAMKRKAVEAAMDDATDEEDDSEEDDDEEGEDDEESEEEESEEEEMPKPLPGKKQGAPTPTPKKAKTETLAKAAAGGAEQQFEKDLIGFLKTAGKPQSMSEIGGKVKKPPGVRKLKEFLSSRPTKFKINSSNMMVELA